MMRRVILKNVLCTTLAALGLWVFGLSRDTTTLSLARPASVGTTMLEPGEYRVSWQAEGSGLNVTFSRNGAAVASSPGKIEPRNEKYSRTSVLYTAQPDGTQRITEIRLAGKREAIVLAGS